MRIHKKTMDTGFGPYIKPVQLNFAADVLRQLFFDFSSMSVTGLGC